MAKKIFNIPVFFFLILGALSITGIIIGVFFDYQISQNVVSTSLFMGRFIESFGMLFGQVALNLSGVLFYKALKDSDNRFLAILGGSLFIIFLSVSVYLTGNCLDEGRIAYKMYGFTVPTFFAYLIGLVIQMPFTIFGFLAIDEKDKDLLLRVAIAISLTILLQYAIIHILKPFALRPRYRYLIDPELNTNNEVFLPFYQFNFNAVKDDFHASFPSGHSGMANTSYALLLLVPLMKRHRYFYQALFFVIALSSSALVCVMRVMYGAHFVSDVSFGAFICAFSFFVSSLLSFKILARKENTDDEVAFKAD